MSAVNILRTAADTIEARARLRDTSDGERSMARAVVAFNNLTGSNMSEAEGWMFMALVKMSRQQVKHDLDNAVDGAAYLALAGEAME